MIQDLFHLLNSPGDKKIKIRMNNERQKLIHRPTLTRQKHENFSNPGNGFRVAHCWPTVKTWSIVEQRN